MSWRNSEATTDRIQPPAPAPTSGRQAREARRPDCERPLRIGGRGRRALGGLPPKQPSKKPSKKTKARVTGITPADLGLDHVLNLVGADGFEPPTFAL